MKKGTIVEIISNYHRFVSSGTGVLVLLDEEPPYKLLLDRDDFSFEPKVGDYILYENKYKETDKNSEYTKSVIVTEDTGNSYRTEVTSDLSMRQISPEYEQDILGEEYWLGKDTLNRQYQKGETIYLKHSVKIVRG